MDVMLRTGMFLTVTGVMGDNAMIYLTAVDTSQILAKPDQTTINENRFKYASAELVLVDGNLKVKQTGYPSGYDQVSTFAALQAALNEGRNIVLTKDLTGGWPDRLQAKNTSVLDLWGHTLDRQKGKLHSDGHVIEVRSGGNLTIKDSIGTGKITGGYANNGGGININEGGTLTLMGGTITGNKADIDGGGICVKGTLIATGGYITNNRANDTGGGIYVSTTGVIQLTNITIANNTSSNYGGGMNVHVREDTTSSVHNSYIINNKTNDVGGGIYYNQSGRTFTVENTVITGNSAEDGGGAIYNNNGTLILQSCNIYNNTTDEDGGAIYNNDATVTITGGTINNNYCKKSGGAIRAYDGTTNINNVTFTSNTAKENGGAIYLNNGGTVSINGCTMEGNTAGEKGGAVIVNDSSGNKLEIKGKIVIHGNKGATGNDLYLNSGKKITIVGALAEGTKIGVTLKDTTGTFTSGYNTYNSGKDPAIFFIANSGYTAYLNGNEAAITKMSTSTAYTVNVSRADGKTTSMTVRLKLLKNGLDYQSHELTITDESVEVLFDVVGGANVYTLTAEVTTPTDSPARYTCFVTEGSALFTVVCRDVVSETETAISAIDPVEYTDECKAKIDAARSAYDALTDTQKGLVDNDHYLSLTNAENKYPALGVDSLINAIGPVEYTDECKAKIDKAKAEFNSLTEAQQGQVTVHNTLTTAEATYAQLKIDYDAADPVIALIDDIGPFEEGAAYVNRVNSAGTAYDALTPNQKALVTNYILLQEALELIAGGTTKPTAQQLEPIVVTYGGWTYGSNPPQNPVVNVDGVSDATLRNHLSTTTKIFTYMDGNKTVVPSNSLPAGTYKLKVTFAHSDAYKVCSVEKNFEVTKAVLEAPTVQWADNSEYTGSIKTVTATAGPLSVGHGMTVKVTKGNVQVDPILPDDYTIKLTINDGNYTFSGSSPVYSTNLEITKATNSITSLSLEGWVYGDAPNTPSATAEVGTPTFTYSSSLSGPYTVNVPKNAGNYYVKATVAETDLYAQTTEILPFTISKATLSVSADSKTVKVGDPMPTFTYSVSGFIGGDTWNGCFNSNPTLTSTCTTTAQYGQYLITISNGSVSPKTPGNNYTLAFTNGVLTIQGDNVHWVSFNLNYPSYPVEDVPERIQAYKGLPYGSLPTASKLGYELGGWYTEASGGTLISSSTIFNGDSDQTLYAHWITTVTLVFGDDEEDDGKMSLTVTYNSNVFETITSPGSNFAGYKTLSGDKIIDSSNLNHFVVGPVDDYLDNDGNWIAVGPKTLYAIWNPAKQCTISFDPGAMTGHGPAPMDVSFGSPYGELPVSDVNGYSVAWYTAKGTKVTSDMIVTSAKTLYARWTMSVNLAFNGGSGGSATLTATYGSNTLQDVTVPTWGDEGTMAFTGYYTSDVGGPVVIAPPAIGTTVTGFVQGTAVEGYIDSSGNWIKSPTTSAVTLYAQWDDAYTVTFEYHSGSGPITTKAVVKNQQIGALPTATKTGYTFNGWFTEATGGSIIETTTVISDNIVVHAQWKAAEYTVTLDPADGSVSPNTVTVTYGSNYGNLPTPVRSGYSFSGWYTAATGGSLVTSSTAVSIADDHTLYAHWSSSPSPSPGGGGGGSNPGSTKHEHIVNPDESVTDRYTTEIRNTDGSKDTQIVEVTTLQDGSTLKKDSYAVERTNPDGSSHKEVKESITATDAEGTVMKTESNSVSDTDSSGASKTTENSRIEKEGHVATRVKVTDVTAEGSSTVTDTIESEVERYGIVTTVAAKTDSSGTVATAKTVIQASATLIDADLAKAAADDLEFAIGLSGVTDVDGQMIIDGSATGSVRASGAVMTQFADDSGDVTLVFEKGSLTYDQKAIGTMSQYDVLEISFSMDDASALSDAQKSVIGSASFVSVKAMSGATYIGELNGTVGISFVFGNEQGWNNFAAYCIEDDGKKIGMEWTYDSDSKLAVISSPHLSIFTVLEKTDDPLGGNAMVLMCAGIVAVLALVAVAYYVQRTKSS